MIEMSVGSLLAVMGIPTAVTGFFVWLLQRQISKRDKEAEQRARERDEKLERQEKTCERNEILLIRGVGAAIALGEATATALKNGHTNGETDAALEYARQVKHEQKDFLTEQGIHALY